jgi:phosphatidylglycerophosphate synthase
MGKKIPDHLDDPFDNALYRFCNVLSEPFYKTKHTPNIITTYSLITGILACYFLYKQNIYAFVALYVISYFFDCFDGYFARRYGMTSKFGDIYDHAKDTIVNLLLVFIMFYYYRQSITYTNAAIMVMLFVLFTTHMGCQQKHYKSENQDKMKETIDAYEIMCKDKEQLRYTRYFGPGMLTIFTVIMISWVWYKPS